MKNLYKNFLAPTPEHIKKWQKILFAFGGLGTAIAVGGAMFDWIPLVVVQSMGGATLIGTFLMQFSSEKG